MYTKTIEKTFLCLIFFTSLFFTSCVYEKFEEPLGMENNDDMFELPIKIELPSRDSMKTKSVATATELTIKDAYVLFFNSSNMYVSGTALTITSHITGNGTTTPKIKFPFKGSLSGVTQAVILFNTGYTSTTIPLTTSNTINDISTKFPSTNWGINTTTKGLPMSGKTTVSNGTIGACTVTRAIAKVNVSTAGISYTTSGSISNQPYSIKFNSFQWKLCNYTESGRIYVSGTDNTTYSFTNWGYGALTYSRYLGAYSNSTKAKTTTVSNTVFNKDRTCIILKANVTENGTTKDCYYRLDFFNAGKYIDINRNTNYTFNVKSIKSRGYSSEAEALANPGSNVDFTIENISGEVATFSNGQYSIFADNHILFMDNKSVIDANVLQIQFKSNLGDNTFNKKINTRTIEIVGSDKKTRVTDAVAPYLKTSSSSGIIKDNIIYLGVQDGVDSWYKVYIGVDIKGYNNWMTLGNNKYFIKISYGNIVAYIPIGYIQFNVSADNTVLSASGGSKKITITSRKYCPESIYPEVNENIPWNYVGSEPTKTGNVNLVNNKILTGLVTSGTGSTSFTVKLPENLNGKRTVTKPSAGTTALRNATVVNNKDLSYLNTDMCAGGNVHVEKGKQNTANCYVVNAPGTYCFPLVMGNGIKNGATNTSAYKGPAGKPKEDCVLENFVDYQGRAISSPWLSGVSKVELLWCDWTNLVTNVYKSGNYIYFTIPKEEICEGNAVICAKDANGWIMWSWHIWITDYNLGGRIQLEGHKQWFTEHLMPRELGFVDKTEYTNGEIDRGVKLLFKPNYERDYGNYTAIVKQNYSTISRGRYAPHYTWGRKDPVIVAEHMVNDRYTVLSGPLALEAYIRNPLLKTSKINDARWHTGGPFANLWDSDAIYEKSNNPTGVSCKAVTKTIYDPSPVGFTVPNRYVFSGLVSKDTFFRTVKNSGGNNHPSWGTVYHMTGSEDAKKKGVNVVTSFNRDTESKLFTTIKDFVMADYTGGNKITFHLDCTMDMDDLAYYVWTAGFEPGTGPKYQRSANSLAISSSTQTVAGIPYGAYIAPAGEFFLAAKYNRGQDGGNSIKYQFVVIPSYQYYK